MTSSPRFDGLTIRELQIPFKTTFKHASAERRHTQSIWVEARRDGYTGYGEGCPRRYVTGESVASAMDFYRAFKDELLDQVWDTDTLQAWAINCKSAIDRNPAAWCAIELALLDLFAREQGCSVEEHLSLAPLATEFRYSAVLGDTSPEAFATQLGRYREMGFSDFKVKLSGDLTRDRAKLEAFELERHPEITVRCDANNLWLQPEPALKFFTDLGFPFCAIEEPLHAFQYDDLEILARRLNTRIVLDESLLFAEQLSRLAASPDTWLINVRVSKMGGLLRALAVVKKARTLGIQVIVGAHVGETSLLTRAGLTVASHAHELLFAQEGAFGTWLLTKDVCRPTLQFSRGGILRPEGRLGDHSGWGLGTALN
ncbi:MAG: hypothetical protein OES09_16005 [Gammaproteobacteria bacterium]|nr:hypothetical protein [Gammaproteobacteria bacterium]